MVTSFHLSGLLAGECDFFKKCFLYAECVFLVFSSMKRRVYSWYLVACFSYYDALVVGSSYQVNLACFSQYLGLSSECCFPGKKVAQRRNDLRELVEHFNVSVLYIVHSAWSQ